MFLNGVASAEEVALIEKLDNIRKAKAGGVQPDGDDPKVAAEHAIERAGARIASRDGVSQAEGVRKYLHSAEGGEVYAVAVGSMVVIDKAAALSSLRGIATGR